MQEIVSEQDLDQLYDIYKNSMYKHPLLNPYQIYARQNIRRVRFMMIDDDSYTYFNTRERYFIKISTAILPIVTSKDYEQTIAKFLQIVKKKMELISLLHVPTRKEVKLEAFKGMPKREFKYIIVDKEWKESYSTKRYVNIAKKKGVKVSDTFNYETYKEYYNNCYLNTLETKEKTEFESGYKFYNYLHEKGMLRATFAYLDDKVISGVFIIHDEESKIGYYTDAGSSNEGRELGANYLLLNDQINYFRDKNYILDLGGVQPGKNKKWDNIFAFKKKWGKEIDLPLVMVNNLVYKLLSLIGKAD
ncbi:hypothetical protein [Stygiolobus caldivivus]|uniref:Uncharacterized protein n=1 Tax=Stygiolobus caldivivus TaxID=2824673 RepID=A0A8D5U8T9_9CREN|nr:hypothetical protein [Stygiolobus caldivivus]BCU70866.1 hypothetical protein KN1_21630 [Stygiolobus caldivivus]